MKLWEGRLHLREDRRADDFNSSISVDGRMAREDIEGSVAHATMLGECGVIEKAEAETIVAGLKGILADLSDGKLEIDPAAEDIHTFVEEELTKRVGAAGKRLHTARSRNDQVATDTRLYLRRASGDIRKALSVLLEALCRKAGENLETVMPGYTHMQRAQPVTFGHAMMAYAMMFMRDAGRLTDCEKRMNVSPLGCGALAGTTYPIDRERTAELLGFSGPALNSLDAVSDRDFVLELLSALSILMMHLSRFCEELVLWCSWEFRFVEMDDGFSTGSSIMPQKKNPDIAELIRGKTGRVYGDLTAMLTVMKGLPLAYDKDMQEDKEAAFDAADTVLQCLRVFTPMLESLRVRPQAMRAAAARGFINATDCADYLVKKGMPFRDAYRITGDLVADCVARGQTLEELPLSQFQAASKLFGEDIRAALDPRVCAARRNVTGGPAPEQVKKQIEAVRKFLGGQRS